MNFTRKKQLATLTVDVVKMTDQNISAIFKQGRNLGLKIGGGGVDSFCPAKGRGQKCHAHTKYIFYILLINKSTICNEIKQKFCPR